MKFSEKTIQIIDDDDDIRKLLRKVLENVGTVVHDASDVKTGLHSIQTHRPDAVILDLNMPGHDGFTFLKARKKMPLLLAIPVIVLSGEKDKKLVAQAIALGADQYLQKPFEAKLILQKLRYVFHVNDSDDQNLSYFFPADQLPELCCQVNAKVIDASELQLRIESPARLKRSLPVQVDLKTMSTAGGAALICRVVSHFVDMHQKMYRQIFRLVDLSTEQKTLYSHWRKK
ncbi:response regulator [Bdellovibrionota bacterium FG-1]